MSTNYLSSPKRLINQIFLLVAWGEDAVDVDNNVKCKTAKCKSELRAVNPRNLLLLLALPMSADRQQASFLHFAVLHFALICFRIRFL